MILLLNTKCTKTLSLCVRIIYAIKLGGARSANRLPLKNWVISLDSKKEYPVGTVIFLNSKWWISEATKLLIVKSQTKQWSKLWCWCVISSLEVYLWWHFFSESCFAKCSKLCTDWNSITNNTASAKKEFNMTNFFFIHCKGSYSK